MNFQVNGGIRVILMSLRKNAFYTDRIEEEGSILIYDRHELQQNLPKTLKLLILFARLQSVA